MELQDISLDDLPLWERMNCDPRMMEELGGVHPKEAVPAILQRQYGCAQDGSCWFYKVMADDGEPAGSVCIWENERDGETFSEIGWMILPEYQRQGLGSGAVRAVLQKAKATGRWGDFVHAHPGITNAGSNGICRKLGFELLETLDVEYAGRTLHTNQWRIDLRTAPL